MHNIIIQLSPHKQILQPRLKNLCSSMATLQTVDWKEVIYRDMEVQMYKIRTPLEEQKRKIRCELAKNESSESKNSEQKDSDNHQDETKEFEGSELIDDFMWIGGEESAFDVTGMKRLGINYVLNCCGNQIDLKYGLFDIELHKINASDDYEYHIMKDVEGCIKFINKAKKNNGKILVHCVQGRNRSATVCCAYLIYSGMNIADAYKQILIKRELPIAGLALKNENFRKQLMDFAFGMNRTGSQFAKMIKTDTNNDDPGVQKHE